MLYLVGRDDRWADDRGCMKWMMDDWGCESVGCGCGCGCDGGDGWMTGGFVVD